MTFDERRCQEIEAAIGLVLGVGPEQLRAKTRVQRVVLGRVYAVGLMRELTSMSMGEIAVRLQHDRSSGSHTLVRYRLVCDVEPYASQVREIRAMIGGGNAHDNGPQ